MWSFLAVFCILLTGINANKCGGNCPGNRCSDDLCICGTTKKMVSDARIHSLCEDGKKLTGWDVVYCKCIAKAESGFNANAINQNSRASIDVGVWQINGYWHWARNNGKSTCYVDGKATHLCGNEEENMKCAAKIYNSAKKTWKPWMTCKGCAKTKEECLKCGKTENECKSLPSGSKVAPKPEAKPETKPERKPESKPEPDIARKKEEGGIWDSIKKTVGGWHQRWFGEKKKTDQAKAYHYYDGDVLIDEEQENQQSSIMLFLFTEFTMFIFLCVICVCFGFCIGGAFGVFVGMRPNGKSQNISLPF